MVELKGKILIILFFVLFAIAPQIVFARTDIQDNMEFFGDHLMLPGGDLRVIMANIINQGAAFLGTLAFLIIIYAGFRWMISGGDDEKIDSAKKTLTSGIIGLFLVVTSYSIANFIINSLIIATGQ